MGVKECLHKRHIAADSICQVCGDENESVIHALFKCTAASEIWAQRSLKNLLVDEPTGSFAARMEWVAARVSCDELRLFGTLAWAA